MSTSTAACAKSATVAYQARLVRPIRDWSAVENAYVELAVNDPAKFHPGFFLAQVCPSIWQPAIVLVYGPDQRAAGMMFLKERTVHGIRSGLFFGDASLGCLITSKKHEEEQVFIAAMAALMQTKLFRGLRLFSSPTGYELKVMDHLPLPAVFETKTVPTECHQILKLTPTYEQFLSMLSYKTRRNFRYFRNRSGNAGNIFVDTVSVEEFIPAACKLQSEQTVGGYRSTLERAIEILRTARRPLLVELNSADGEMLSFVAGWWQGTRAFVFMQLNNDKKYPKDSLSLTMRSYLIEFLIGNGCTEIVWWSGVSEPLKHYCEPVQTVAICLDNRGLFWRMGRKLLESVRLRVPRRFHALAEMVIAPAPHPDQTYRTVISVPGSL